jgi:hypothetical protein
MNFENSAALTQQSLSDLHRIRPRLAANRGNGRAHLTQFAIGIVPSLDDALEAAVGEIGTVGVKTGIESTHEADLDLLAEIANGVGEPLKIKRTFYRALNENIAAILLIAPPRQKFDLAHRVERAGDDRL